jgi:hypothetical protein
MMMDNSSREHEHEFEPQYGLPERLPQGESILWQASPDVATLAREAFHPARGPRWPGDGCRR